MFIQPTLLIFLSDITLFSGGIQKEILFSLGSGFVGKMDHTVSLYSHQTHPIIAP